MAELTLEERFNLIESIGEEVIDKEQLLLLLKNKSDIIAYDGKNSCHKSSHFL
jgi:hypothetical protein